MRKLTKEEWVERAILKHGDKFDYSMVNFKGVDTLVKIICKDHGLFEITPYNHTHSKYGCEKCAGTYKMTTEEMKSFYISKGYLPLFETYSNNTENLLAMTQDGYFTFSAYAELKAGKTPEIISPHNPYTLKNISTWLKINNKIYTLISDTYIDNTTLLKWNCPLHGEFDLCWNHMQYYIGCQGCADVSQRSKRASKIEDVIEQIRIEHNDNIIVINHDNYEHSHSNITCECRICGCIWNPSANNIKRGNSGCPGCDESKGELAIKEVLINKEISFIRESRFDDCRHKRTLPFDFYLPDYNCCIEYDGEQHFRPIEWFGGEEKFVEMEHRDSIKNKYCKENGIKLIRIPYFQFDKAEEIIIRRLKLNTLDEISELCYDEAN